MTCIMAAVVELGIVGLVSAAFYPIGYAFGAFYETKGGNTFGAPRPFAKPMFAFRRA